MIARELRYEWLYEIKKKYNFSKIVIAHHINDAIETFLLNFSRGTGLKGLLNMYKNDNEDILRPLLDRGYTKSDLINYCKKKNLPWREDISNSKNVYKRNLIRNKIIPILKEINPSLEYTFVKNLDRLKDVQSVWNENLKLKKEIFFFQKENYTEINTTQLLRENGGKTILCETLSEYDFFYSQILDFLSKNHISGKKISSSTHTIITSNDFWKLYKNEDLQQENFEEKKIFLKNELEIPAKIIFTDNILEAKIIDRENFSLKKEKNLAQLDLNKIKFPIYLSQPKPGDFFMPLGMKNKKKLSDFFIDEKVPLEKRKKINILKSDNDIVWIIGQRISEKHKITNETKKILEIKIIMQQSAKQ